MSILRNRPSKNFVIVPKELLLDPEIGNRAKILYSYLCSKPDYSKFSYGELMDELKIGSRLSLWKYFKELVDGGWISRRKIQGAEGLFGNGEEFMLQEIKFKGKGEKIKRSSFYESLDEDEKGYYTLDVPEVDLGHEYYDDIVLDNSPESTPRWFLAENDKLPHSYTSEFLFTALHLLDREYLIKRYKIGSKYKDFMFLGSDIKNVNLTVNDVTQLREIYPPEKIRKMILTLDAWFELPQNLKHKKFMICKSCKDYFKKRQWLEEKVRQELMKEEKKNNEKRRTNSR